ncbi:uncharacterized protein LOC115888214 [Sitophilus oryzae]|uniref:Uncharacterized protein LOC115888214 n=1 Tax=Sitophilus oryzae TaxID=7048 RepID=A0A6J2YJZ6_SITOR|nr:uncharacterized protein LOC115888214 [Sitophilus oryzae]
MGDKDKLKEQLSEILTEVAKVKKIKDFELIPDVDRSYGDGFMSQFYTGQVKNRETGENFHIAIKKCPENQQTVTSLFNNEKLFYESIFPMMRDFQLKRNVVKVLDNVPGYICGSMEPKKEYIAMDHVKNLGYELYDKTKCFNAEHLRSIFKLYGKFHAVSFSIEKSLPEAFKSGTKGTREHFCYIHQHT